jgi:N-acetylneuraminic acid mutarotase
MCLFNLEFIFKQEKMKQSIRYTRTLFVIVFLLILLNCQKEVNEERDFPRFSQIDVADVNEDGVTFIAEINYKGKDEIIDHGFYWFKDNSFNPRTAHHLSMGKKDGEGVFQAKAEGGLNAGIVYHLFAYVRTIRYEVYSPIISFNSLGSLKPVISDFYPKIGQLGDTVTITGRNLGYSTSESRVYFNDERANILSAIDTVLKTIVPRHKGNDQASISIISGGMVDTINMKFSYVKPHLNGIIPSSGVKGDTVVIQGSNFGYADNLCEVYFGTNPAKVLKFSDSLLKVIVPSSTGYINAQVTVEIDKLPSSEDILFTYQLPIIEEYFPNSGIIGDTVNLKGRYFGNPLPGDQNFKVKFGGQVLSPLSYNDTLIKFIAPSSGGIKEKNIQIERDHLNSATQTLFNYLLPEIAEIAPSVAYVGDTLIITGDFKGYSLQQSKVMFNTQSAAIVSITNQTIKAIIPSSGGTVLRSIRIESDKLLSEATPEFRYYVPEIIDYYPKSGTIGDTITITGINFGNKQPICKVSFGGISASVISHSIDEVEVILPGSAGNQYREIIVEVDKIVPVVKPVFTFKPPVIHDFNPKTGKTGTIVTITGESFSKVIGNNQVFIGPDTRAIILSAKENELVVKLPIQYSLGSFPVSVIVNNMNSYSAMHFQILEGPWKRIANYYSSRSHTFQFVIEGLGYVGGGRRNSGIYSNLHQYNPATNQWNSFGNPGMSTSNSYSFSLANEGYYGVGRPLGNSKSLFSYSPETRIVTTRALYPLAEGYTIFNPTGFVINGKAYVGTGNELNLFCEYNPSGDLWTIKAPFPGVVRGEAVGFSLNGYGYLGLGTNGSSHFKDLWRYDPVADEWLQMNDFPGAGLVGAISFLIDGMAYVGLGRSYGPNEEETKIIWAYDPVLDVWTPITELLAPARKGAAVFVIDNKAYIGLGQPVTGELDDFYEFDPSKL